MKQTKFQHKFVDSVPEPPKDGVLYISLKYETAIHLCACGCGTKVVTPLSLEDWVVILDGESASLFPSIGNWSFDCRSHYWIRYGKVVWANKWTDNDVWANRFQSNVKCDSENCGTEHTEFSSVDQCWGLWSYLLKFFSFRNKHEEKK